MPWALGETLKVIQLKLHLESNGCEIQELGDWHAEKTEVK